MSSIIHPTFLINEARCRANIQFMVEKARRNNLCFRPHFKTHQSREVASWFEGLTETVTVSSLAMAEYFMDAGWKDLTLAFPVNIRALPIIRELSERATLNILVESTEVLSILDEGLNRPIKIFIKVDVGYGRTGVPVANTDALDSIIADLAGSKTLDFAGFLTHAGHSYGARSYREIEAIHQSTIRAMRELKERYSADYPNLILSVGDTPTCSVMDDFSEVDEIRPGNFVFFDLMQVLIGSCEVEQVAVAMACPIVALHPERNEIVIHGGGVHFSKESLTDPKHGTHYGQVVESREREDEWGELVEGAYVKSLSQEHGTIAAPKSFIDRCQIGDLVKVLPVHSCMTANLMSHSTQIVSF